ncbi:hypothetical protein ACFU5O_17410 [Streptomyces sp. NPDC057445]|uniref:hypothetical protein n=1 Tax=Streptomyces sp. NPDC057445 TaxID=3346136 RepID=UPI0036CF80C3
MAEFDFPDDLRDAQLRLHRARAEYQALCRTLPWSVEPAEGWTAVEGQYSGYRRDFPATPGYTDEQKTEVARLRALMLELSTEVTTHPYWATVSGGDVVDARMELKHHPDVVRTDEPTPGG